MRRILNILSKNWLLVTTLIAGVFLRFYKLSGFTTFLGDQGRDAIILKRIITLEHFPAIGAPTSIGQVYLGPFYYYFIAPWLLFFRYHPIGPVVGVAIFSSLYMLINYFIVKELVDKKTALVSTVFLSFSSVLIELSRFSWNPNLLPLFTLLTIYFFIKSVRSHRWYFFALTGAFLSFSIQLHYLALFILPTIGVIYGSYLIRNLKNIKKIVFNFLLFTLNFSIFSSPLIIFDLRHQFLNSKNFIKLFQESGTGLGTKINSLFDSFYYLNFYSFHINLNKFLVYLLLFFLIIAYITLYKQKSQIKTFLLFFLLTIFFMSLYSGQKHPHYFGVLYPMYYVIVAYFLAFSQDFSLGKILLILFVSGFVFLNFQKYPYFYNSPNNQIDHAKKVANFLNRVITDKKFNFAVQPDGDPEDSYLYFLELEGKIPLDRKRLEVGNVMFVVCSQACDLKTTKSWNVNMFGKFKIANEWKVDGVKIYKLIR